MLQIIFPQLDIWVVFKCAEKSFGQITEKPKFAITLL